MNLFKQIIQSFEELSKIVGIVQQKSFKKFLFPLAFLLLIPSGLVIIVSGKSLFISNPIKSVEGSVLEFNTKLKGNGFAPRILYKYSIGNVNYIDSIIYQRGSVELSTKRKVLDKYSKFQKDAIVPVFINDGSPEKPFLIKKSIWGVFVGAIIFAIVSVYCLFISILSWRKPK